MKLSLSIIISIVHSQCELDVERKKELECQLHAADHSKLNEITAGLLASANHLVKVHFLPIITTTIIIIISAVYKSA